MIPPPGPAHNDPESDHRSAMRIPCIVSLHTKFISGILYRYRIGSNSKLPGGTTTGTTTPGTVHYYAIANTSIGAAS